ncbi:MAG: acetate--CoA ligase family protein [Candidatus Baldrarchaeia archaeon]
MTDILSEYSPLLEPRSIAVVGATPRLENLGFYVVMSLKTSGYEGRIFAVNPRGENVQDVPGFKSIKDIPEEVDMIVVTTPARVVPSVVKEAGEKGVRAAVIISAGFKETGSAEGIKLQEEVIKLGRKYGIKIVGPNTFGIVNLHAKMNASFTPTLSNVKRGNVSIVSQSGGICHIIAYYGMNEGLGFGKIIGLGNRCIVDFSDMLYYLADDPQTRVIALYIEGVENARELLAALEYASERKPVVVYKVGKMPISDKASLSHTGALAGNYKLYIAGLKQHGAVIVNSCIELFDVAKALSLCPIPRGKRVAIASKEAGPSMVALDFLHEHGLEVAEFSEDTTNIIGELLPPVTIRSNPVDLGFVSTTNPLVVEKCLDAIAKDPNVDALLFISLYHPVVLPPLRKLAKIAEETGKPVVASITAPPKEYMEFLNKLQEEGVPLFPSPERAVKALAGLAKYAEVRERIKLRKRDIRC